MKQLYIIPFVYIIFLNYVITKRGPHHPRGHSPQAGPPKLDEHFIHEAEHLREDLGAWAKNKELSEMTEDEKNFYYFKVHDADNNDFLDGLEMLQAATHRAGHIHKIDRDEELLKMEDELNRIVGKYYSINLFFIFKINFFTDVIDDFLSFADLNHDGYLNYPEYAKAINTNEDDSPSDPQVSQV